MWIIKRDLKNVLLSFLAVSVFQPIRKPDFNYLIENRHLPSYSSYAKRYLNIPDLLMAECHTTLTTPGFFICFRESCFDKKQNFASFIQNMVSFYNIHRDFIKKRR